MDKKFDVYKWRRNYLLENELRGSWVDKKGTFNGKEYDGYFKTTLSRSGDDVKKAIKDKNYTYVGSEEWDDDDRKTEYWFYFRK